MAGGVVSEGVDQFEMVALSVPPRADMHAVKARVTAGVADGHWTFEEGCIGDARRQSRHDPVASNDPAQGNALPGLQVMGDDARMISDDGFMLAGFVASAPLAAA